MSYKNAVLSIEETIPSTPPSTMIKLTNPFYFNKEIKEIKDPFIDISFKMRQRWEQFHILNGTWYDYSDDGSCYSDDDEFDDDIEDDWE
jgi:hypothetical protein